MRIAPSVKTASGTVLIACTAAVAIRAATAPSWDAPASDEPARRQAAEALARQEPSWRLESYREFPGDHWSQDDNFHMREDKAARHESAVRSLRLSEVLLGIDEHLRRDPSDRVTTSSPCKPRPFYD